MNESNTNPENEQLNTPPAAARLPWKWLALVVLLIVLGAAVYFILGSTHKNPTTQSVPKLTPVQQYHTLANQGKYEQAEQVLDQQRAQAKTTAQKIAIYCQQSLLATQSKQYTDAKTYAGKALKLDPKSDKPYVALAHLAEAQGDKAQAAQDWQKAIDNLSSATDGYNLILRDYQSSLEALK